MKVNYLDANRKMLVNLLSAAINGAGLQIGTDASLDWQVVFDYAIKHQVLSLLYPVVERSKNLPIPEELLAKCRAFALAEGARQERNYIEIGKVLRLFLDNDIPVIVLKGLVLRELYPYPALRSMSDIDLLVHPSDMQKAGALLKSLGYMIYADDGKHINFSHEILPEIELHRSLFREERIDDYANFQGTVWENARPLKISGTNVYSLCPQDEILYLCLHMTSHIISGGFGLRQLCDFVLFIDRFRNDIDWNVFFEKAVCFRIDIFVIVLIKACNTLFSLLPPKCNHIDYERYGTLERKLISDIFDAGIFGNTTKEHTAANRLLRYSSGKETNNFFSTFLLAISLLFPSVNKLDVKYRYAKKYRLLLPFAWLHRAFYSIIRRDIDFYEKRAVLTSSASSEIYTKRSKLLRSLGLLD